MEQRKSAIKIIRQCRFCLTTEEPLSSIYDRTRTAKNTVTLPLQILSCVAVEAFPSDGMPSVICDCCRFFMDVFYRFKQVCRSADESILQYIQTADQLQPIPWASKLKRIFHNASRPSRKVKTLVSETGATVQVTASNDLTDSEEDDDNVYNIKIEGQNNAEGTCIKVIKAGEELHIKKDQLQFEKRGSNKSMTSTSNEFKCKLCDKVFSKAYHYTRHLRQKHNSVQRFSRGPFGQMESFRCEQCNEEFASQDDLIYHSAKHATENLTCPLCQEKFNHVEEVSAHIKTHAEGAEFMCDLCELVFTARSKLDAHLLQRHADELRQEQELDEDSVPMDDDGEEETCNMNVTEENGEMIVEITKPDEFLIGEDKSADDSNMNTTNSEESENEASYLELQPVEERSGTPAPAAAPSPATQMPITTSGQTASILKRAEEIKKQMKKAVESKPEPAKAEVTATADKSLRLLEKELQELQRTNSRSEPAKTPAKPEVRRGRPQLHASTPKPRPIEEKKTPASVKTPVAEKKAPEKRTPLPKENKEPKEIKGNHNVSKDEKDKVTPKSVKNGASGEESVRRSSRTSKVTDYAKMIKSQDSSDDSDDEEYTEEEAKISERARSRRVTSKPPLPQRSLSPKPPSPPPTTPLVRKRGRPRKENKELPTKVRKSVIMDDSDKTDENELKDQKTATEEAEKTEGPKEEAIKEEKQLDEAGIKLEKPDEGKEKEESSDTKSANRSVLVSPSGQALKKVPVKSLPPGVKALPLPINARSVNAGKVCEMQIGKKVVKVQKIVMTKAEVEAMAKKGLVEMKDGTMVLKQGIKLPTSEVASLKSTLVGGDGSPTKPQPSRCNLDDD